MVNRTVLTSLSSALPEILFVAALAAAFLTIAQYLDTTEQLAIRQTDSVYLTRLDQQEQQQYRDYRNHRVYPDPAERWVLEERELQELRQWIKAHDLVIEAALAHDAAGD